MIDEAVKVQLRAHGWLDPREACLLRRKVERLEYANANLNHALAVARGRRWDFT